MSIKKILKWIGKRAKERSTYVGLATVAVAVGAPGVAEAIGQVGQVAAIVFGSGLAAASTAAAAE